MSILLLVTQRVVCPDPRERVLGVCNGYASLPVSPSPFPTPPTVSPSPFPRPPTIVKYFVSHGHRLRILCLDAKHDLQGLQGSTYQCHQLFDKISDWEFNHQCGSLSCTHVLCRVPQQPSQYQDISTPGYDFKVETHCSH